MPCSHAQRHAQVIPAIAAMTRRHKRKLARHGKHERRLTKACSSSEDADNEVQHSSANSSPHVDQALQQLQTLEDSKEPLHAILQVQNDKNGQNPSKQSTSTC